MKSVIRYLVLLVLLVMPWLAHAQSSEPFVFHAGATEDAPGGVMNASHYSTIVVQIEGTFTGSVLFEKKTKDATGWVAVQCTNAADRTVSETSATAVGYWECPGGAYNFRARADWDSGTIVVTGHGTIAVSRSGGGGGSGSVTSVDASGGVETASGSAITGTGTIRGKLCVRAVTGTTDTITANDRGCIVTYTNADPIAVSIAEAGTTGFESGFYFQPVNLGAGTVTITPSTSTIQAGSDLDLATGKSTTIASDGTNYVHAPGLGLTAEAQSLADVITINRTYGGAVSQATGVRIGDDGSSEYWNLHRDGTTGLTFECEKSGVLGDCDKKIKIYTGHVFDFLNDANTSIGKLTESTGAWTNFTLDGEGSGNTITLTDIKWFDAAACQNGVAQLVWNVPASNAPAAACDPDSTPNAYASFDASIDESFDFDFVLPPGFAVGIDAHFIWKAAATSGAAGWCMQLVRVPDATTSGQSHAAQSSSNCVSDTAKGTTLQENRADKTGITCTSCAAGDRVKGRISRDANGGAVTDDMAGDAHLIKFGYTLRDAK